MAKEYLGDAVYVDMDQFGSMVLTTSDGMQDTNTIVLESEVIRALLRWIEANKKP